MSNAVMTEGLIQPIIGHLLSKYDSTAIEGLERIIALTDKPALNSKEFSNAFVCDSTALSALVQFFDRQCDLGMGFKTCESLLAAAGSGEQLMFCRFMLDSQFFSAVFKKYLVNITANKIASTCGCLSLLTAMTKLYPKIVMTKLHYASRILIDGRDTAANIATFAPHTFGIFNSLSEASEAIRPYRCSLLCEFASTPFQDMNIKMICTHGYLTAVVEDMANMGVSSEFTYDSDNTFNNSNPVSEAISKCLSVISDRFVSSPLIPRTKKRELLLGQKRILSAIIKTMNSCNVEAISSKMFNIMRKLVVEVREETSDYLLTKSTTDTAAELEAASRNTANESSAVAAVNSGLYMPNFILLVILRLLRPKAHAIDSKLLLLILQFSTDLIRPYYNRIVGHLLEDDKKATRKGAHYAAIINIFTRVSCCELPYHIEVPGVSTIQIDGEVISKCTDGSKQASFSSQKQLNFYCLLPKTIVEEICPVAFGTFIHKMIKGSENLLYLLMAVQATQAVLQRASRILKKIEANMIAVSEHRLSDDVAFLKDRFMANVELELRGVLPRIEEFWHRIMQQVLPLVSRTSSTVTSDCAKGQYILQRLYLLTKHYAEVFHLRNSWLHGVPQPEVLIRGLSNATGSKDGAVISIDDIRKSSINVPVIAWESKSVASLCALLLNNLCNNVPLPKLHHISLGGSSIVNVKEGSDPTLLANAVAKAVASEWPPLLSLLHWFVRVKNEEKELSCRDDAVMEKIKAKNLEGITGVTNLLLWCVHNVSLRFSVTAEEVYLWLKFLTPNVLPLFLHLLNYMLQLGLSKAVEKVSEALFASSTHGIIHASSKQFISRQREKQAEKLEKGGTKPNCIWQNDIISNLDGFEKVLKRVEKHWENRQAYYKDEIVTPMNSFVAEEGCRSTVIQKLIAGSVSDTKDMNIPLSARIIMLLLQASSHYKVTRDLRKKPRNDAEDDECVALETSNTDQSPSENNEIVLPPLIASVARQSALDVAKGTSSTSLSTYTIMKDLFPLQDLLQFGGDVDWKAANRIFFQVSMQEIILSSPATFYEAALAILHVVSRDKTLFDNAKQTKYLLKFCSNFLQIIVSEDHQQEPFSFHLGEEAKAGFALLTTAVTKCFLVLSADEEHKRAENIALCKEASYAIAKNYYHGTLGIVDRIFYGSMLMLEVNKLTVIMQSPSTPGDHIENNSSDSEKENGEEAQSFCTGKKDIQCNHIRKLYSFTHLEKQPIALDSIRRLRYAVGRLSTATTIAPEVDVLAQILEGWSDNDIRRLSTKIPLKINSSVLVAIHENEHDVATELLRIFYPEVSTRGEYILQGKLKATHASDFSSQGIFGQSSANSALIGVEDSSSPDPRYLFPLIRTVGALRNSFKNAVPAHLITRCIPFLIRGTSLIFDIQLRNTAAISLMSAVKAASGIIKSVVQYLWMKISTEKCERMSCPFPRAPTPLTSFLIEALYPLHHYNNQLHNHVVNCFVTAKTSGTSVKYIGAEVYSHPCPLSQLLTEFPLHCLTSERMLTSQEAMQRNHTTIDSGTTALASAQITENLRKAAPPHLHHILSQLRHSVATKKDLVQLINGNIPSSLFFLVASLQATPVLRLEVAYTIVAIVTSCQDAAKLAVEHPSVRIVSWALMFCGHLKMEFDCSMISASDNWNLNNASLMLSRDESLRAELLLTIVELLLSLTSSGVLLNRSSMTDRLQYYSAVKQLSPALSTCGNKLITSGLQNLEDILLSSI